MQKIKLELTPQEQYKLYMELPKKTVAKMLVNANDTIDSLLVAVNNALKIMNPPFDNTKTQ